MNKRQIIASLIDIASKLDQNGFYNTANTLTNVLTKLAAPGDNVVVKMTPDGKPIVSINGRERFGPGKEGSGYFNNLQHARNYARKINPNFTDLTLEKPKTETILEIHDDSDFDELKKALTNDDPEFPYFKFELTPQTDQFYVKVRNFPTVFLHDERGRPFGKVGNANNRKDYEYHQKLAEKNMKKFELRMRGYSDSYNPDYEFEKSHERRKSI